MEPISLLFGVVGLSFAVWQYHRRMQADRQLKAALDQMPIRVAAELQVDLRKIGTATPPGVFPLFQMADVDGNGEEEVLIQYPAGVHGSALKVFGWRAHEFTEIADLRVGTPVGFEVGDFDSDGQVEIRTQETDWDTGLSYAEAPRVEITFRWDGKEFAEVARRKADA